MTKELRVITGDQWIEHYGPQLDLGISVEHIRSVEIRSSTGSFLEITIETTQEPVTKDAYRKAEWGWEVVRRQSEVPSYAWALRTLKQCGITELASYSVSLCARSGEALRLSIDAWGDDRLLND